MTVLGTSKSTMRDVGSKRFQSRQLQGLAKPSYRRHKGLSKPFQTGGVSAKPNVTGDIVTKPNHKGDGHIKPKLTCDIPAAKQGRRC
jgi:hypothetical protein